MGRRHHIWRQQLITWEKETLTEVLSCIGSPGRGFTAIPFCDAKGKYNGASLMRYTSKQSAISLFQK